MAAAGGQVFLADTAPPRLDPGTGGSRTHVSTSSAGAPRRPASRPPAARPPTNATSMSRDALGHRHQRQHRRLHAAGPPRRRPAAATAGHAATAADRAHHRRDPGHRRHLAAGRPARDHPGCRDRGVPDRRLLRLRAPDRRHRHGRRRDARRLRRDLRLPAERRRAGARSATTCGSPATVSEFNDLTELARRRRLTSRSCGTPDRSAGCTPLAMALPDHRCGSRGARERAARADRPVHGHRQLRHQPVRRDRPGHRRPPAVAADRPLQPEHRAGQGRRGPGRQRRARGHPRRRVELELPANNQNDPMSWLTPDNPVRIGSPATLHQPVILDYRNSLWKLQPTSQVTRRRPRRGDVQRHPHRQPGAAGRRWRPQARHVQRAELLQHHRRRTGSPPGHTCTFYDDRAGDPVDRQRLLRQRPAWCGRVQRRHRPRRPEGRPRAAAGQGGAGDQHDGRRHPVAGGDRELRRRSARATATTR